MSTTTMSQKVALLLNQAENTKNENEAKAFMKRAQQLASMHSIDVAKARHALVAKERTVPVVRNITLGLRKTKGLNTLVTLMSGIASANDVRINIAHNSTYVIAFGFEEDIDVCEAMFASLSVQMANAAAAHKKLGEWKNDTVWSERIWDYKPVSWLTARLDFQQGFGYGVHTRLREAKLAAEKMAMAVDEAMGDAAGTELVLVEKRAAVDDLYKAKSTARGSHKGYKGGRTSSTSAGTTAGRNANLGGRTAMSGARTAIG